MEILVIFCLLGYALHLKTVGIQNSSVAIFLSTALSILALYILGLLNLLQYGSKAIFLGGIALLAFGVVKNRDGAKEFAKQTPVVVFVVLGVLYWLMTKSALFFFWDEFSHWGLFIKEMKFTDKLYDAQCIAAHLGYLPGSSLWQYFVMSFSDFNEHSTFFANFLLIIASTLMVYEKINTKNIHWLALVFVAHLLLITNYGLGMNKIYVDPLVSCIFIGTFMSIILEEWDYKNIYLLFAPLAALLLVKEVGLYFAVALSLFVPFYMMLTKSEGALIEKRIVVAEWKKLLIALVFIIGLVAIKESWSHRQASVGIAPEGQSITGIVKAWTGSSDVLTNEEKNMVRDRFWEVFKWQYVATTAETENYNEFSYQTMPTFKDKARLSTAGMLIVSLLILVVGFVLGGTNEQKKKVAAIGAFMFATTLGYLAILYGSYFVAFGNDALRLPSYTRYVNIALLPLLFVSLSLFLPVMSQGIYGTGLMPNTKEKLKLAADRLAFFAVTVFLLFVFETPYTSGITKSAHTQQVRDALGAATEQLTKKLPPRAKLFIVFPIPQNGSYTTQLRYLLHPLSTTVSGADIMTYPKEKVVEILKQNEYIWVPLDNLVFFGLKQGVYKIGKEPDNNFKFTPIQ